MKLIVIAALIWLAGCATHKNDWYWQKDGSTEQDFNQDQGQCHAQAFGVSNAPLMQVVLVYDGCMRGKGWNKVAASK